MKIIIDTKNKTLVCEDETETKELALYSKESFEIISHQWLKVGWNEKYPYTFSWLGRPIIQLPEDIIRIQEVIYQTKPDVIIETGVAHGGSLIFYAGLCKILGKGKVIGVDIEIRAHNRKAIEAHELFSYITLIENNSIAPETVELVKELINSNDTVLVILDSHHSKDHVAAELEAYSTLVSTGSYIIATDGSMQFLFDVPRGDTSWENDHPSAAAIEFVETHPEFKLIQPEWPFNESKLTDNITHWPQAWLKKIS